MSVGSSAIGIIHADANFGKFSVECGTKFLGEICFGFAAWVVENSDFAVADFAVKDGSEGVN